MRSTKKVKYFMKLVYDRMKISPLKFDHSIQATMNKIIKEKKCKNLVVEKISDEIFIDGNTHLDRVTYYYDMKNAKYLGFHFDFIVGVSAKTLRLKELNLYSLDDNGYYSSTNNVYISLAFDLNNDIIDNLNHFLCIANKTKRIAILPKIRNRNKKTFYKSYVMTINVEVLERRFGKNYRESSFLDNKYTSSFINKNKIIIDNRINMDYLSNISDKLIVLTNYSFKYLLCSSLNYSIPDNQWQRNNQ